MDHSHIKYIVNYKTIIMSYKHIYVPFLLIFHLIDIYQYFK